MKKFVQKTVASVGGVATALQTAVTTAWAVSVTDTQVNPGKGFANDIGQVINGVLSFVMVIAALLVFTYLIWGGIEWITSGGDKGKTENARNKITAAVIGLVVLAASYAILILVLRFLGFTGIDDALNITPITGG